MDLTQDDIEILKSLINSLLNKDMPIYKDFAKEIYKATDKEIENLLKGNVDFEYKFLNHNQNNAEKLIYKFFNFHLILQNWYKDLSKHDYIQQLWKKNPNFELLQKQ